MTGKLSQKQQAFVEYYLQSWNATEAAKRAGYSDKSAYSIGSENLKKPDIKSAIDARLAELKMSSDEVLTRLAEHARSSMADFVTVRDDGKPSLKINPAKLHLMKKIAIKPGEHGTAIEFELYDAQTALVQLGRAHSLFVDKKDFSSGGKDIVFNIGVVESVPPAAPPVSGD